MDGSSEVLPVERPLKWEFQFDPVEGAGGIKARITFDSTIGLVAFLLAGLNVAVPGAIQVKYIGGKEGSLMEIAQDEA